MNTEHFRLVITSRLRRLLRISCVRGNFFMISTILYYVFFKVLLLLLPKRTKNEIYVCNYRKAKQVHHTGVSRWIFDIRIQQNLIIVAVCGKM